MKAVTICQPYAELIARGDKPIENRSWPTSYRGPLAIHAGKSRAWLGDDDERKYGPFIYGAVVAVADLVACLNIRDAWQWPADHKWLAAHEHANGPWCWVLDNIRRLPTPIPARGAQGLFDIDIQALTPDTPQETNIVSWQPIPTAPTDGTRQIVGHHAVNPCIGYYAALSDAERASVAAKGGAEVVDGWYDDAHEWIDPQPTHWTPLPDPPSRIDE